MNEPPVLESKAAALRRAFDLSFALPPPPVSQEVEDLLAIRVAGDPYAVRLRDIAGMVAGRRVVPVPATSPDLLGLAGIRGGVVPVFALASLLGYGQAAAGPDAPRWMVLCGVAEPIALAFSDFEGYLRTPTRSIHENANAAREYVGQVANTDAGAHAVINIPLIVLTIRNRSGHHQPSKGQ